MRVGVDAYADFAVVNGTSLPPELAESELFGHDRVFTEAVGLTRGLVVEADSGPFFVGVVGNFRYRAGEAPPAIWSNARRDA